MKNYNKIVSIDEYLIREVLNDNEKIIVRFVELTSPYIYGALYKFTQLNREEIDDLYQSVFLKLFEKNKYRIKNWNRKSKFTTYLYMIVINTVKDYLRSSGYKHNLQWVDSEGQVANGNDHAIDSETLQYCFKHLSGYEQEVIDFYFFKEMKEREIAEKLNKPLNTISSIKYRALKKIRKILKEKNHTSRLTSE